MHADDWPGARRRVGDPDRFVGAGSRARKALRAWVRRPNCGELPRMTNRKCRTAEAASADEPIRGEGPRASHEDRDILVVISPPGSYGGTDREKERTGVLCLTDMSARETPSPESHLHRPSPRSGNLGVLVFARLSSQTRLQRRWTKREDVPRHRAWQFKKHSDTITTYLAGEQRVRCVFHEDAKKGSYRGRCTPFSERRRLRLLDVELLTAENTRSAVHLADQGHPVVGDTKYGRSNEAHKRCGTARQILSLRHPVTGDAFMFDARCPPF